MKIPVVRWFLSLPASMLYCLIAILLQARVGSPTSLGVVASSVAGFFLHSIIAQWTIRDAHRRRVALPYDAGSFIFFTWPVSVPVYLFSTRGWKGLAPIGGYVLIYLAAAVIISIPFALRLIYG